MPDCWAATPCCPYTFTITRWPDLVPPPFVLSPPFLFFSCIPKRRAAFFPYLPYLSWTFLGVALALAVCSVPCCEPIKLRFSCLRSIESTQVTGVWVI